MLKKLKYNIVRFEGSFYLRSKNIVHVYTRLYSCTLNGVRRVKCLRKFEYCIEYLGRICLDNSQGNQLKIAQCFVRRKYVRHCWSTACQPELISRMVIYCVGEQCRFTSDHLLNIKILIIFLVFRSLIIMQLHWSPL